MKEVEEEIRWRKLKIEKKMKKKGKDRKKYMSEKLGKG